MLPSDSQAVLAPSQSAFSSAGSNEKLSSGPPPERSRVKCFSIIDAPSAMLVIAVVLTIVRS